MDENPALTAAEQLLAAGKHVHLVDGGESHCLGDDCRDCHYPFAIDNTIGA